MAGWLKRLVQLALQPPEDGPADPLDAWARATEGAVVAAAPASPPVVVSPPPTVSTRAAPAWPDEPPAPRFSVLDQLLDDPRSLALRAEWEARWAEF